jgi:hypothetical protein
MGAYTGKIDWNSLRDPVQATCSYASRESVFAPWSSVTQPKAGAVAIRDTVDAPGKPA